MRFTFPGRRRANRLALLLLLLTGAPAGAEDWKTYTDPQFTVRYPGNWLLRYHDQKKGTMDIVNIPGPGMNATGIDAGQGAIGVRFMGEPPDGVDAVIDGFIDQGKVLSRKTLTAGKGKCDRLQEVATQFLAEAPVIQTGIFCTMGPKVFLVGVTSWSDDKRQGEWQAIAHRMAASLRVPS